MPFSILLLGASGAMGRRIEAMAPDIGGTIQSRFDADNRLVTGEIPRVDVAIDFTLPDAVAANVPLLIDAGIPVVVGTTGWEADREAIFAHVAEKNGTLLWASNFSIGLQSFLRIVRQAARLLDDAGGYDVAMHEDHHTRKADSPSGTALSIAEVLLDESSAKSQIIADRPEGPIDPNALHVTSRRIGNVIGTHEVIFDAPADSIELVHRARNRSGFAEGALRGARWLVGQEPGVYRFEEEFEGVVGSS